MDLEKIVMRDRIKTCFHEAGHLLLARHCGLNASCFVVDRGVPSLEEVGTIGKTSFAKTTPFNAAVIALAGELATMLFEEETLNALDVSYYVEDGDFGSETDRAFFSKLPPRRMTKAIQTAIAVLTANEVELRRVAHALRDGGPTSCFDSQDVCLVN